MFVVTFLLTAALAAGQDMTPLAMKTPRGIHHKHHKSTGQTTGTGVILPSSLVYSTLTSLPFATTSAAPTIYPVVFTSSESTTSISTLTSTTSTSSYTSSYTVSAAAIEPSATGTVTVSETTYVPASSSQPSPTPNVQGCYEAVGGLKADGIVYTGCGALLAHIDACFLLQAPWTNPYDDVQSAIFQSCVCETSADAPFTPASVLAQNFTGCVRCMMAARTPDFDFVTQVMQSGDNFCRSQNPNAYLFINDLTDWLHGLDRNSFVTAQPIPDVTAVVGQLYPQFTTTPPLANLAYGASAPWDGSLGEVTPSLTTYTTIGMNGTATITLLVTWLPTETGKTFDGSAASKSAAAAASDALSSDLTKTSSSQASQASYCYGRGPCQTGSSSAGIVDKPPRWTLWLGHAIVVARALL